MNIRTEKLKKFFNLEASQTRLAIFLITPTAIAVFGILFYPLAYSFYLSFTNATLTLADLDFIKLQNYIKAFKDSLLMYSFWVTIKYVFFSINIKLITGIVIALVLKEKFIGRGIARSLILIPWAVPYIVSGTMWRWLLDSTVGPVNFILKEIGIISKSVNFTSDKFFALPSIIVADVWQSTPFFIIIILAGLQTIPDDLYEAATIDGAGSISKFFSITLPMIKFPLFIVTLLGTIFSVNQFDLFYIMTKGGPANYTMAAIFYNWNTAFKYFNISYASAISYLIMLLSIVISVLYIRILSQGEK